VLLAVDDVLRQNKHIIDIAEHFIVPDERFKQMMRNGKQTVGRKELQFALYDLKTAGVFECVRRGIFRENAATINERIAVCLAFNKEMSDEFTRENELLLNPDAIQRINDIVSANWDWHGEALLLNKYLRQLPKNKKDTTANNVSGDTNDEIADKTSDDIETVNDDKTLVESNPITKDNSDKETKAEKSDDSGANTATGEIALAVSSSGTDDSTASAALTENVEESNVTTATISTGTDDSTSSAALTEKVEDGESSSATISTGTDEDLVSAALTENDKESKVTATKDAKETKDNVDNRKLSFKKHRAK
jgi:hypothetical protein